MSRSMMSKSGMGRNRRKGRNANRMMRQSQRFLQHDNRHQRTRELIVGRFRGREQGVGFAERVSGSRRKGNQVTGFVTGRGNFANGDKESKHYYDDDLFDDDEYYYDDPDCARPNVITRFPTLTPAETEEPTEFPTLEITNPPTIVSSSQAPSSNAAPTMSNAPTNRPSTSSAPSLSKNPSTSPSVA